MTLSRRTRVLLFVPSLRTGGEERQLQFLATGVDRDEFEVLVWCPGPWGPVGDSLVAAGVTVLTRDLDLSGCAAVDGLLAWLRGLRGSIFYSFAGPLWADVTLAKAAGFPICITRRVHTRFWDGGGKSSLEEDVRNAETDIVVANCAAAAQASAAAECLSPQLVRVIANGVPLAGPVAVESSPRVLIGNVANYRPLKGHRFLIEAFGRVRAIMPLAQLVLVGRVEPELERLVNASDLRDGVSVLGELADPALAYRTMSLYVHASLSEGAPCAVLEAMSHGLPVIATDAGGTAEQVQDGVTGMLVRPADAGALARAMVELLGDEPKRRRMAAAGRARVAAEFSIDLFVNRHQALFREQLSRCG